MLPGELPVTLPSELVRQRPDILAAEAELHSAGTEIGTSGLVGRKVIGKGVAIFCQVDPDRFEADKRTYFRYTRWRSTRAVAQLLANLGASFVVDSRVFRPLDTRSPDAKSEAVGSFAYYHPDYRTDFPMGDNPYRYYRW